MSQALDDPMANRFPPAPYERQEATNQSEPSWLPPVGSMDFFSSDHIEKLAASLAKAQGEIENPEKNRTNPHFKSKYADLAAIIEVTKKPLSKNDLVVVQLPTRTGTSMELRTMLLHSSGQYLGCVIPLSLPSKGAQPFGSELTYMRRYALSALLNVAADDDDDGNEAQATPDNRPSQQPAPKGKAMDRLAETIGANAAPTMRQEAADIERQQKQKAAEDYLKSLKEAITNAASHDDDTLEKVVGNADAQRKMSNLEKYPELHRELVAHCAQAQIVGKIGFLQSANSALYDKIITASQSKAVENGTALRTH